MTAQENKDLIRQMIDETWNKGNEAYLDDCLSPRYTDHDAGFDPLGQMGKETTIAEIQSKLRAYRQAFPDLHVSVDDQVAEEDQVVTRWTATGPLKGPLGRIPPTGKTVSIQGVFIYRLEGDKIVDGWTFFDTMTLLQQVGALPSPQQAGT